MTDTELIAACIVAAIAYVLIWRSLPAGTRWPWSKDRRK
jgi:hypothetical protein